jgi:ABC-type antimicrobial peptide transport system permease subunit
MGMLLYGLKNVGRYKIRTLIVMVLVGLPFFVLLMMSSVEDSMNNQIKRIQENVGTLIQIRPRGSLGHINQAGGLNRLLPVDVTEKIKGIDHITKVETYLIALEPIANYYMTVHVGVGIGDIKRLESHGEVGDPKIIKGRDFVMEDSGKDVAIVGKAYARKVGVDVDAFTVETYFEKEVLRPGPGVLKIGLKSIGGKPFKIVGIFSSGYNFGDNQMFLPFETFKRHYGVSEEVSKIYITIDSTENLEKIADEVRKRLGPVADVITVKSGTKFVSLALGTMKKIARAWVIISILLMVLIILFSMLLVTDERYKEIGTLKAMGASASDIGKQFITESILLALIGGTLGTILFKVMGSRIGEKFFIHTFYVYMPGKYGQSLVENIILRYDLSMSTILFLITVSIIVGLIGSSYSILKTRKMSPMEAIRYG